MLLVSSLTPSGRAWAMGSAIASIPDGRVFEPHELLDEATFGDALRDWGVRSARSTSVDLVVSIQSLKTLAMLVSAYEQSASSGQRGILWIPGSVSAMLADLQAVDSLMGLSALPESDIVHKFESVLTAVRSGAIEWLVACPPEDSAVQELCGEVAAACAMGMRVRGICVAPMPRKSDGWPAPIRAGARDLFRHLKDVMHPLAVSRAKRGSAPIFIESTDIPLTPTVVQDREGEWIWSVTLPGLSKVNVQVGSWSSDTTYPVTHVVLRIDQTTVHLPIAATLRRCEAVHAIVAGDSVAVTFVPAPLHWPQSLGESGEGGEDG